MAIPRLLLLSLFLTLVLGKIAADAEISDDEAPKPELSQSSLEIELEHLKSKISSLESSIAEKTGELKSKDENIKQMENILQEKSATIALLQSDVQAREQKGSVDVKEQLGRAHARVGELENQVDSLRKELETQTKKRDAVEARLNVAEKKVLDLNLKLESLKKINDEQKSRIHKTERALQAAEEEMVKARLEATTVAKDLTEVRQAWIPHWLATHLVDCQSFIVTHWKETGKPILDSTFQEALQKKDQLRKWAEPHVETVKTTWIPIMKDQWVGFVTQIRPHVESLTAKTIELYHASKDTIQPHVVKIQEMVDPHFQEVKKITKPYIDQVATVAKPHLEKTRVFLKPYTKNVVRTYKKFVKAATMYHRQVQATISEKLRNHELTKALATDELVLFVASALMAVPVIVLFKVVSAIFWFGCKIWFLTLAVKSPKSKLGIQAIHVAELNGYIQTSEVLGSVWSKFKVWR
ncbi:hypothetical protein RHGRI_001047 [Rhododendron griersonianum]|uniref:Uncharacterized protein n=1 Tax=Rhododendron griersonianum TaxID=479676 RepID=A0AAV6LIS9_9ERIC|nr:hypothetical protein RHGRI_001047 [Rhododendron griersonianum]